MQSFPQFDAIALGLGLGAIALVFVYTLLTGAPPVPTSARVWRTLAKVLPRRLPKLLSKLPGRDGAVIYELGSGWGGNARRLAKVYPDDSIVAIERSPLPWLASRLRQALGHQPNLTIRRGNFMNHPLGDAALVVCYLSGGHMPPLAKKLAHELAPGALVLSHTFAMPDWRATDTVHADDIDKTPVYLYEVGLYEIGAVAAVNQVPSAPES